MNESLSRVEQISGPITLVHVGAHAEDNQIQCAVEIPRPPRFPRLYKKLASVLVVAGLLLAACSSVDRPTAPSPPPEVPTLSPDTDTTVGEQSLIDQPEAVATIAVVSPSFNFEGVMTSESPQNVIDVDEVGIMQQIYPEFLYYPASVQSADTAFEHIQVLNMLDVEVDLDKILALRDTYRSYVSNNPVLEFGGERLTLGPRQKRIYGLYIVPDTVPVPGMFGIPPDFEPPALTVAGDNGYVSILRFGSRTFSNEMTSDPLVDLELSLLIETCQSLVDVHASDPEFDQLQQEIFCNSVGRGMLAAMAGLDYDSYSQLIRDKNYSLPDGVTIYLHPIPPPLYAQFRQLTHGSIFKIPALP